MIAIQKKLHRNNEKRKEKSRDAARCRRSRETEIFTDLASVLPARAEEVEQLDKASVMRLAIAYLKVRGMMDLCKYFIRKLVKLFASLLSLQSVLVTADIKEKASKMTNTKSTEFSLDDELLVQALDGFLMILSVDGDVTYVSENVAEYLGIQQVRLDKFLYKSRIYLRHPAKMIFIPILDRHDWPTGVGLLSSMRSRRAA